MKEFELGEPCAPSDELSAIYIVVRDETDSSHKSGSSYVPPNWIDAYYADRLKRGPEVSRKAHLWN